MIMAGASTVTEEKAQLSVSRRKVIELFPVTWEQMRLISQVILPFPNIIRKESDSKHIKWVGSHRSL